MTPQYVHLWNGTSVISATPWADNFDRNSDVEIYVRDDDGTSHFTIFVEQRLGYQNAWRPYLTLKSDGDREIEERFEAQPQLRFILAVDEGDIPSITGGILRGVTR